MFAHCCEQLRLGCSDNGPCTSAGLRIELRPTDTEWREPGSSLEDRLRWQSAMTQAEVTKRRSWRQVEEWSRKCRLPVGRGGTGEACVTCSVLWFKEGPD